MKNLIRKSEISAERAFDFTWSVSIRKAIDNLLIGFFDKTLDPTIDESEINDFTCLLAFKKYLGEVYDRHRESENFNEDDNMIFLGSENNTAP